jgi:hypothetical protein
MKSRYASRGFQRQELELRQVDRQRLDVGTVLSRSIHSYGKSPLTSHSTPGARLLNNLVFCYLQTQGRQIVDLSAFFNVLRKNNHEELKRYEDIAPLNLEFAVNEAVNTLRRRQEGATTSTDAGEGWTNEREGKTNGSVDTNIEQKPQGTASLEKRADTGEAKPVLIQAFDKGELDGIVGYEVLKASGHTRPAEEYHKAEAETGGEPEALSA